MDRLEISVLGISELKWTGRGYFDSGDHRVYYSGHDSIWHRGVAFLVNKKFARSVLGYNPISDRVLLLRLKCSEMNLTIIQVYAPTTSAQAKEIEEFYNQLQSAIDLTPAKDMLIVMGDLNAKVGECSEDRITGNHGLGERNEAGEKLIEFCSDNNLWIGNTWYELPIRRKYTWTSPNHEHRNQIDYIMCKQRWRSSITSVKTRPGADCGSDHELLLATVKVKFRKINAKQRAGNKRLDLSQINEEYNLEVKNRFDALKLEESTPNEIWEDVLTCVTDVARAKIPPRAKRQRAPWLSQAALDIASERKAAKINQDRNQVKLLNRAFQRQARLDKNKFIEQQCAEIKNGISKGRCRDCSKKIKTITGQFTPRVGVLKNKEGRDLTEVEEITKRWKNYTEELYQKDPTLLAEPRVVKDDQELEPDILEAEARQAISQLANNKASGVDDTPIELFKALGDEGVKMMHTICNKIWKSGSWPTQWRQSVYIPIPKRGDARLCENNRTIALILQASKVLLKIIQKRLEPYIEKELPTEQAGFRKGRGTRDQIANLRWIMEKSREYQKDLYICFIDYSKAFDSVDHAKLWVIMDKMGIPSHITTLIKNLYTGQEAVVRTEAGDTEWFPIGKGVRQGCILSPCLFNLYTEHVMREAEFDVASEGVKLGGRNINNLRYADDTTILAESDDDLRSLLRRIKAISLKYGLHLNIRKTKTMPTGQLDDFSFDGEQIEVVKKFTFLGAEINSDGSCSGEIRRRLALGRAAMQRLSPVLSDRGVSCHLRGRLIRALVFPVVLYGCERWTLSRADRRRLDSFELWCWRRMLRISWTAKVTNSLVLIWAHPTMSLESMALKLRLTYFGHVMRAEGMEKQVMVGKTEGGRRRGRQRMRWLDGVMKETGKDLTNLKNLVVDRTHWRTFIHGITKGRERLNG